MKAHNISPHTPTLLSSELIASCYFEICSLYSCLFFSPDTLLLISTKRIKALLEMIDQVSFLDDGTHSTLVRLKFINSILNDHHLFEICNRNMTNFQLKLVSFLIYAYLNTSSGSVGENNSVGGSASANVSLVDLELNSYMASCVKKIVIFNEMNLRHDSTLENFLIEFIAKYSQRLKETQVNKLIN